MLMVFIEVYRSCYYNVIRSIIIDSEVLAQLPVQVIGN